MEVCNRLVQFTDLCKCVDCKNTSTRFEIADDSESDVEDHELENDLDYI